jgi:hypothetical protein
MISKATQVVGAAVLLGACAACVLHGEFHPTLHAIELFLLLGIGLLLVAVVPAVSGPRFRRLGEVVLQGAMVLFVAIPVTFGFGRAIFAADLWHLKRFVQTYLSPQLAAAKAAQGAFPLALPELESLPHPVPWLLARCLYRSNGAGYTLSFMDPGICGRTFTLESGAHTWQERKVECWY